MRKRIPENLLSVYDLTVPYAFDIRKLRKQLDAELEKRHPCFPERCEADYHLCFQSYGKHAGGFHIRALVIDRLQLAAIRKKHAGCLLYSGGSHPYPVFSSCVFKKRMIYVAFILTVLILGWAAVRQVAVKKKAVPVVPEVTISIPEPVFVPEKPDELPEPVPSADYSPFINSIYVQGGSISSCFWNAETGTLSVTAAGLFPEQLAGVAGTESKVSFGSISYHAGVPELEVKLTELLHSAACEAEMSEMWSGAVVLPVVRNIFLENGGSLFSETVLPPSLKGSVPENAWASFAASLQKIVTGVAVSVLELMREGDTISVILQFSVPVQNAADALPCVENLPLSDIAAVFADAPGLPFEKEVQYEPVQKQLEIGRITRGDGFTEVFFRNENGKIERRMYEN